MGGSRSRGGELEYAGGGPAGSDGVGWTCGALALGVRITGGRGWPGGPTDILRLGTMDFLSFAGTSIIAGRFSDDPLFSASSCWMREIAVNGRLTSSLRARSRSRRISTSMRHSTILLTSSNAYTLTPSLRPAMATRTPRCSITTTLLNAALLTKAYGCGAGGDTNGRTSRP